LSHVKPGILLCGLLAVSIAHASIITQPPGVAPGDPYRLIFVTSAVRDATSSNIADYNSFVSGVANAVPALQALGADWRAIASTPSTNARDNVAASTAPIFRLDGTLVANGTADLWDSFILAPILIDENGHTVIGNSWSGSRSNGTATGDALGTAFLVRTGLTDGTNRFWLAAGSYAPNTMQHLYAISSEIVAPVPEPMSVGFVAAGFVLLIGHSRINRMRCRR
jgi:hypothetical protein